MIYLFLLYEFSKIGLFSFGGGYATLPFLYDIAVKHGFYTIKELTQMIAVASITPGPVGINVATYAGLKIDGVIGALSATIAEMLPSLILVIFVSKLLNKYKDNFYVKSIIETLKPISCALLASVAIGLLKPEIVNIQSFMLLGLLLILSWNTKKDPIFYMLLGGLAGVLKVIYL